MIIFKALPINSTLSKLWSFNYKKYSIHANSIKILKIKRSNMKNYIKSNSRIFKIFAIIILCTLTFKNHAFSQGAASVEVDAVILEPLNQSIPVIGRIVSLKEAKVPAAVIGKVQKVLVEVGDKVKKGQVLALIDIERYKWLAEIASAKVSAANAELKSAKAETNINLLELNRMENLKKSSAFNVAKFEKLQSLHISLLAKEEITEAQLKSMIQEEKLAGLNLKRATVKAPFDGIIEYKKIELGEGVGLGFTLFNLISEILLEVRADVPSERARILEQGNSIKITTTDNIAFSSKIRAIGVRENSNSRTIPVHLKFDVSALPRKLFVGENVNISIPIGPGAKAPTVHKDAILKREGMSLVYIVKEEKAQIKPVKLGDGVGNRFIVLSGIEVGDIAVVKGNERLRPGQKVAPIQKSNTTKNEEE
jgi:RND family efflux transporter MFP subunit